MMRDATESFAAYSLDECVQMKHYAFLICLINKAWGEGGTEPIILLQYILGNERQIHTYIYSV